MEEFIGINLISNAVCMIWLIYCFFPQLKSLIGTKVEWLYYILQAFNTGDLIRYQELCNVHKDALNAQPALVANERKLLEKINILCLMEIIFRYAVAVENIMNGIFFWILSLLSFWSLKHYVSSVFYSCAAGLQKTEQFRWMSLRSALGLL